LTQNIIESWSKEIKKVARRAELEWPGVAEADDIEQEVYLHILERPGTQRDLAEMDDLSRYRTLHKIAQRIASNERTKLDRFHGNFKFSVDEVRSLLESLRDPEKAELGSSWSDQEYTASGGGHSDPTANMALENVRVSESQKQLGAALEGLKSSNRRQYDALVKRFVYGIVPEGDSYDTFMLIKRAVESVTKRMNNGHKRSHVGEPVPGKSLGDGPGTRKAISNSTARYLSKEGWDADYMPAPAHLRDNHIEPEVWD